MNSQQTTSEHLNGLEQPRLELDSLWIEEAERRLVAYRAVEVKGIPAKDVVGDF